MAAFKRRIRPWLWNESVRTKGEQASKNEEQRTQVQFLAGHKGAWNMKDKQNHKGKGHKHYDHCMRNKTNMRNQTKPDKYFCAEELLEHYGTPTWMRTNNDRADKETQVKHMRRGT